MRIISGEYRGRILKSPFDYKTRPTSDRLRESLFSILNPLIAEETRFLDLCAGTGAVGIEALSRGVGFTAFVEKSRRVCALIEENLDLLQIPETKTEVIHSPAEKFTAREPEKSWDIVFFDPPYQNNYGVVLYNFGDKDSKLLASEGIFIAQHHFKNTLPETVGVMRCRRVLKQGETQLSFYERN